METSRGHFLVVITNGANTIGQPTQGLRGAKPLVGSGNTVQCQVRGCGGEAPARISKHCARVR